MVLIGEEKMISACKNTVIIYNPRDGPIKERGKAYIFHSKYALRIQAALYLQILYFCLKALLSNRSLNQVSVYHLS